ncbi:MAG: hypothetical protein CML33_00620 [Rhodobacteraceae bacterium]|jgi:hypothetical protein|nr:hypothetical protein [Paracoccaceae bacterium]
MSRYTTLPVANKEYEQQNEQVARRTIEQSLQDISSTVEGNTNKTNKTSSLALRRFQFLLMGASNG